MVPYQGGGNLLANGTTTPDFSATGFGGAVSGHFNLAGDSLVWSLTGGNGIGRYMFGSLFQGAINDGTKIDLWKGMGWHVGYTHNWDSKWRSNIIYSQVTMSDPGTGIPGTSLAQFINTQGGGADLQPNKTLTNALFNTFYQITKTTFCGVEYNWGQRKTFDFMQANGEGYTAIPQYTGTMKRVNFIFHVSFF